MYYLHILRRQGAVPGLTRLISLILECISSMFLLLHQNSREVYTTDYTIVSYDHLGSTTYSRLISSCLQLTYLVLVDVLEIASLCAQGRGWSLPALPIIISADSIGGLMLLCSRDWYGLWYWHGPYYSLSHKIGLGLFIALP